MAETTTAAALRVKQWDSKAHTAYIRSNRFKRYMGSSQNSIFCIKEDLTKKDGDAITLPLVGALDSSSGPNTGTSDLVGNELALPNDGHRIDISVVRQATVVNVEEEQSSAIDIREAGKVALKSLQMQYLRNDIITSLHKINGINYGTATQAQRDAWLVDNADRVTFGASVANGSSNDHSVGLATVDAVNDRLNGDIVSMYKRRAQNASSANSEGIRPYEFGEDMETFVMFVNSYAFRDMRTWMVSNGYWENAMARSKANPLFSGPTSIEWDGVMIREIPEIGMLPGVGNSGIDVTPVFLCGAQALGIAWARRTKTTLRRETDYDFRYGVGFLELRGVDKIQYGQGSANAKDWAVKTGYVSSVADV